MDTKAYCDVCGLPIEEGITPLGARIEDYFLYFHPACFDAMLVEAQVNAGYYHTGRFKELSQMHHSLPEEPTYAPYDPNGPDRYTHPDRPHKFLR